MKRILVFVFIFITTCTLLLAQEQAASLPAGESNKGLANEAGKGDVKGNEMRTDDKDATGQEIKKEDQVMQSDQKEGKKGHFEYIEYNSFGLNVSSHSGIGLAYRYHMSEAFLFQISGGVISEGKSYYYALGAEVQRELSKVKDKRAFGSFAIGLYGSREKETYYVGEYYEEENRRERWSSDNTFAFAIGVGGELAFGSSVKDNLTIGCEIYPVGVYLDTGGETKWRMYPGLAIYLFYNF